MTIAAALLLAASGLVLGSYAVTAGLRLARQEGSALGRSQCDACGQTLGFVQTVPVASYVLLKGACAYCRARIDPIHLAGEVAGAAVLLAAPWTVSPSRGVAVSVMGLVLIAASAVDAKTQRLPDILTAVVAAAALTLAAARGWAGVASGLAAAMTTVAILLIVRWRFARRIGDPGLGLGDVKLAAALALWLGAATPFMALLACCLALAVVGVLRVPRRQRLALGPMLAAAGMAVGVVTERGGFAWAR